NIVCSSQKFKDKTAGHLFDTDERYKIRLNSDIVYLVGNGDYHYFDSEGYANSGIALQEIENLDKCKFIFFSSSNSAKHIPDSHNLVTKAVSAGATTAMGLTNGGYNATAQKSFGEWLFYYLRVDNNSIAQAAQISKSAIEGDGMTLSYGISGDPYQVLFPSSPNSYYVTSSNDLMISIDQVLNLDYTDVTDIGNGIVRYSKTINGIKRNINNVMTPVEINYNNYVNEKGYGYQDVVCYNLYDGSQIDFADIINLK
ncbi:MAG TPA: hypothetical protein VJZ69_02120, partial [Clostridia bacterium]|nr:hypothetical protein [Clostridia bacterium]